MPTTRDRAPRLSFLDLIHHAYLAIFARYPWLIALALLSLCAELVYASLNNAVLPLFVSSLLPPESPSVGRWVAVVTSTFLLTETLLRLPFGHLSDRVGRRPLIVYAPLAGCLSPILLARLVRSISQLPLLLALRVYDAACAAAIWPTIFTLVGDRIPHRDRATAMSVTNMIYLVALGLGPFVAFHMIGLPFQVENAPGRKILRLAPEQLSPPFYLAAALLLLCGLIAFFFLGRNSVSRPAADNVPTPSPLPAPTGLIEGPQPLPPSTVAAMLVITFAQSFAIFMLAPYLVLYGQRVLHLLPAQMGWVFIIPAIGVALFSMPCGRLADAWRKDSVVKLALAIAAAAMWFLPIIHKMWALAALGAVFAIAYSMSVPAWLALIAGVAPESGRGRAMGRFGLAQGCGAVMGPFVAGFLWDHVGPRFPFFGSALILSLSVLLALAFVHVPNPPPSQKP